MWHVVDLHNSQAKAAGIEVALRQYLAKAALAYVIRDGALVEEGSAAASQERGSLMMREFASCPIALVGVQGMSPTAPFLGAVMQDENRALVTQFIDFEPFRDSRAWRKFFGGVFNTFADFMFREAAGLQSIEIPVRLEGIKWRAVDFGDGEWTVLRRT